MRERWQRGRVWVSGGLVTGRERRRARAWSVGHRLGGGGRTSTAKMLPLASTMMCAALGYCTSSSMPWMGRLAEANIGRNADEHILPLASGSSLPSSSLRVHLVNEHTNAAARAVCEPGVSTRPKNGLRAQPIGHEREHGC